MRITLWRKSLCFAVAVLVSPTLLLAYSENACRCGKPTPESYTWNFSQEASGLLKQVKRDSLQVRNTAGHLQAVVHNVYGNDWQMDGDFLNTAIPKVKAMDRMECRLRLIERKTTPEQQETINRVVPEIIILTDTMNRTVRYLKLHENYLWNPSYIAYSNELYNSATSLFNDLQNPSEYMAMQNQAHNPQS